MSIRQSLGFALKVRGQLDQSSGSANYSDGAGGVCREGTREAGGDEGLDWSR